MSGNVAISVNFCMAAVLPSPAFPGRASRRFGRGWCYAMRITAKEIVMQKVLGFTLMLVSGATMAGWFGPSNYDECLLDNMKGVASNTAAVAIAQACRSKFPLPPPPPPKPKSAEELVKEKEQRDEDCRKHRQQQAREKREVQQYEEATQNYFHGNGPMPGMPPQQSSSLVSSIGERACQDSQ